MEEGKNTENQPASRLEIIDRYLNTANIVINKTHEAINDPVDKKFYFALGIYEKWLLSVYSFLKEFDEHSSQILFSSPDGVRTILNTFKERAQNFQPEYYLEMNEDGKLYSDEVGIKMLQNIILSMNDKIHLLRNVQLNIEGGILSDEDTKKVSIIYRRTGVIKTSIDDQEIKRKTGSVISKIVKKLMEKDNIKLISLSKDLKTDTANISNNISSLNKDILNKWTSLKADVITTKGSGYYIDKDVYNFYFENLRGKYKLK